MVRFCHLCYQPEPNCNCPLVTPLAPHPSWSQSVEPTPSYGTAASSRVTTTQSTSLGGMSELLSPPLATHPSWSQIADQTPSYGATASSGVATTLNTSLGGMSGLMPPPPGFSIWDPNLYEIPVLPIQPVPTSPYEPPRGRGEQLQAQLRRRGLLSQAPQAIAPIHQPLPYSWSQPATPYWQAVQAPVCTPGPRVSFDSNMKPAPTGSQITDAHRRLASRG